MRVLSFFLTVLLFIILLLCLQVVYGYYSPHVNMMKVGLDKEEIKNRAMPFVVLSAVYFVAFLLSLFFLIKKKHVANSIFAGLMVLAFIIAIIFF